MRSINGGLLYVNIAPSSVSAPSTLTFDVGMEQFPTHSVIHNTSFLHAKYQASQMATFTYYPATKLFYYIAPNIKKFKSRYTRVLRNRFRSAYYAQS